MADEKTFESGSIAWTAMRRKLEFPGDGLLLIYFVVLARQYLWWITNRNGVAWVVATLVAGVCGWFYISTRESSDEKEAALPFWLVVVLPLLFVYAMRVVFPDVSFDVLNYHLLH